MDKETKTQFEYRVIKIHTVKFSFSELDEDYANHLFKEDQLKVELNVLINIDKSKSTVSFEIHSALTDTQKEAVVIQHEARTVYEVKGIDKVYSEENDTYNIPDDLVIQLYAISFSHARALLSIELSPTVFKDKYFLPVVNPSEILKNF